MQYQVFNTYPLLYVGLLSEQRSSHGHHRCVTPLYLMPMGIFDYVMGKGLVPASETACTPSGIFIWVVVSAVFINNYLRSRVGILTDL